MEPTNKQPLVDVVVLNYNGKRFLDDCFNSVFASTYPNFKLHMVDNSSTDDSVDYVRSNFPNVNIIQNPENNGFCAAYNLGLANCSGEFFICLNNDVVVKPDWIDHLVDTALSDPKIAAIQSKMLSFFDEKKYEYAGSSGGVLDIYGYPFLRGRVFDYLEDDKGQYNDTTDIFWTCGAAMFIRTSVLKETGNFDESIVHHMDEIDLNWRFLMHGYRNVIEPKSVILHIGGATIPAESFKKIYWNHRNSIYLMLKNYDASNVFSKTAIHVILDYVAIIEGLLRFKPVRSKAIIAAHRWIWKNRKLIAEKRKEVQAKRIVGDAAVIQRMYPKSVVWQYFIKGKKTYSELIKAIH